MKLLDLDLEHCFSLTPISNSSVHSTAGDARARQGDLSIVHGMEKWKECTKRTKAWLDLGFGILSLSMRVFLFWKLFR